MMMGPKVVKLDDVILRIWYKEFMHVEMEENCLQSGITVVASGVQNVSSSYVSIRTWISGWMDTKSNRRNEYVFYVNLKGRIRKTKARNMNHIRASVGPQVHKENDLRQASGTWVQEFVFKHIHTHIHLSLIHI